jgi:hypothetical protein
VAQELQFVTKLKKDMKNRFLRFYYKLLLRKRALIETLDDQLRNISRVEHKCHRSLWNFLDNVMAVLVATRGARRSRH